MRQILLLLPLGGCGHLHSALHPIEVVAEREVRFGGTVRPGDWVVEGKSDEQSYVSGRNNLTAVATLASVEPGRVRVAVRLTSTMRQYVEPDTFYVWLDNGDQRVPLSAYEAEAVADSPYDYTYTYTATVKAGTVVFADGSKTDVYTDEVRQAERSESYYSRDVIFEFQGDDLVTADTASLVLELRDLGVDMQLGWVIAGGAR